MQDELILHKLYYLPFYLSRYCNGRNACNPLYPISMLKKGLCFSINNNIFFFSIRSYFVVNDLLVLIILLCTDSSDSELRRAPAPKVNAVTMSRTNSSPGNFESLIGRPMRLSEIYVAAEHALQKTISDPGLWKCMSSVEDFEVSSLTENFEVKVF